MQTLTSYPCRAQQDDEPDQVPEEFIIDSEGVIMDPTVLTFRPEPAAGAGAQRARQVAHLQRGPRAVHQAHAA